MDIENSITKLFEGIDNKDIKYFSSNLDEDVFFRFGNMPGIKGKAPATEAVRNFFDSISSLSHQIDNTWSYGDTIICNGTVTYTRKDQSSLSVPFADIFIMKGDKVSEYLIYADISGLYR
jgi:ketosteroid isomerase-like protein